MQKGLTDSPWVCLDRAKNNAKIKELRIVHENSKKIVIFR
jgi:hypothetical protein